MSVPLSREEIMERPLPEKLVARLSRELMSPTKLSAREMDVLALYACGYTSRAIGEMLHLSRWTVSTHAKNLRFKLGATTMAHAVALALIHKHLDSDLVR